MVDIYDRVSSWNRPIESIVRLTCSCRPQSPSRAWHVPSRLLPCNTYYVAGWRSHSVPRWAVLDHKAVSTASIKYRAWSLSSWWVLARIRNLFPTKLRPSYRWRSNSASFLWHVRGSNWFVRITNWWDWCARHSWADLIDLLPHRIPIAICSMTCTILWRARFSRFRIFLQIKPTFQGPRAKGIKSK